MNNEPYIQEIVLNAPASRVWKAITDKDDMKQWYFELPEFNPKVGFEFSFEGGDKGKTYLHLCRVTEVEEGKKIAYTWKYDGYEGESLVTWELFEEGNRTRLKLTHAGLETFPADNPDLARHNFVRGWTGIIGTSLKNFVETKQ